MGHSQSLMITVALQGLYHRGKPRNQRVLDPVGAFAALSRPPRQKAGLGVFGLEVIHLINRDNSGI